jgi:Hint domain
MTTVTLAGVTNGSGETVVDVDQIDPFQTLTSFVPYQTQFAIPVTLAVSETGELAVATGDGVQPSEIQLYSSGAGGVPTDVFLAGNESFYGGTNVVWLDPTLLAVGYGVGAGTEVAVFDTSSGTAQKVDDFYAFGPTYTEGVTVAGIDSDHVAVATNGGGTATVAIFDIAGDANTVTASFQPFGASFTGALSISALPNGDLAVGTGPGGASQVNIYDASQRLIDTFNPFNAAFIGGIDVAWLDSTHLAVAAQNGGSEVNVFDVTDNEMTDSFFAFPPPEGATLAQNAAACYCRGTQILTDRGERRIETLQIGDTVRTASGALRPIIWIGRRSYGGRFIMSRADILPVCIKANALGDNEPKRDLWISPHHAMYFADDNGGVLVEAKDLVNGKSIVQAHSVDKVEYFHIELDTHDVIIAEGALSETFIDDDSRAMFHNALEFDALYAEEHAPGHYCAPRVGEGYEVEAVRSRLAQRAGLLRAADSPQLGALRGYVDRIRSGSIAGWAQNADAPEAPVCLDIFAEGKRIGRVLANIYRDDLKRAGLGSGRHSFEFTPPAGLDFASATVEVRRALDGAALQHSNTVCYDSSYMTGHRRAARR